MIDIVTLDKVLGTLSFITPFLLYGGMVFVLAVNERVSELYHQYFQGLILRLKEYLLLKGFQSSHNVTNDKHYTKSTNNQLHRINNHR
ncbi:MULTISPECIES: hypothetical protein [Pelosinus]|uniref:hypothetical protein n=1 Tax=Pelosinus TaxID=365348 RepID=UPI00037ABC19|nr:MULTISPECIES: hypothetical protein [Pelosinus]